MNPKALAEMAVPIVDAISADCLSEFPGVSILPERICFTLTVAPEEEARFRQLFSQLLRESDSFGLDAPFYLLALRWVSLPVDGEELDETKWGLVFELNPRRSAVPALVSKQISSLLESLRKAGIGIRTGGGGMLLAGLNMLGKRIV